MRFAKRQKLICILPKGELWYDPITGYYVNGPRWNDIVTAAGYVPDEPDALLLEEWPDPEGWLEDNFEPLISDEELLQELESIPESCAI